MSIFLLIGILTNCFVIVFYLFFSMVLSVRVPCTIDWTDWSISDNDWDNCAKSKCDWTRNFVAHGTAWKWRELDSSMLPEQVGSVPLWQESTSRVEVTPSPLSIQRCFLGPVEDGELLAAAAGWWSTSVPEFLHWSPSSFVGRLASDRGSRICTCNAFRLLWTWCSCRSNTCTTIPMNSNLFVEAKRGNSWIDT